MQRETQTSALGPRGEGPTVFLRRDPAEDRPGWTATSPRRGFDTHRVSIYTAGMTSLPGDALGREALAYADALHNLARYLTGNDGDADDLVQETYFRALKAADQFAAGTNLKAWLYRILRNTFISLYRRQRSNPTRGGLDTTAPIAPDAGGEDWLRDDLELDRLRNVVAEDIERALMTLSEEARTVILLDLEGHTETEVAEIVGCAVGTVKSRLARARAALRQRLRDYRR